MARSLLFAALALPGGLAIREQFYEEAGALSLEEGGHELCAPAIVADTCAKLNFETATYFGTEADADTSIVHAAEIAEYLHASRSSVLEALSSLGLTNLETNATALSRDALGVSCAELCQKVVAAIPRALMPPQSDLACFVDTDSPEMDVDCNVDVSPNSMKGLAFNANYKAEGRNAMDGHGAGSSLTLAFDGVDHEAETLEDLEDHGARDADFIFRRIANAFRIYPASGVEAQEDDEDDQDDDVEQATCPDYCSIANCAPTQKLFHVCRHCDICLAELGQLRRRGLLSWLFGSQSSEPSRPSRPSTTSSSTSGKSGNSGKSGKAGKSSKSSKPSTHKKTTKKTSSWRKETIKVGLKAQAYINQVYRNMRSRSVPHFVERWFGDNGVLTRKKIFKVLASVDEVLDNAAYRYLKGSRGSCDADTYAYVYPEGHKSKSEDGKFKIFLCDLYMESSLGVQIETLTHEGSHHGSAFTDDVCYHGSGHRCTPAYGREKCERLAGRSTRKALNNADNYCFFINDAYDETN